MLVRIILLPFTTRTFSIVAMDVSPARPVFVFFEGRSALIRLARMQNPLPFQDWADKKKRGMSVYYDLVDWVGGYPFEVAKPEQVFDFYRQRGFVLRKLKTFGAGSGCNEFVFFRNQKDGDGPRQSRTEAPIRVPARRH